MTYEVYILPGFHSSEIEASSEEDAKRRFVEMVRDNLDVEHVDSTLIDEV